MQAFVIFDRIVNKFHFMKILSTLLFCSFLSIISTNLHAQDFEVPKKARLEKAEDYTLYEDDVLEAITWLNKTPVNQKINKRKAVNSFVMKWISGTSSVKITIHADICPFVESPDCFLMFMAGWTEYSLINDDKDQVKGATAGLETVIAFYQKNKDELGKVKGMRKLIKLKKKGKLEEFVKESFE